MHCRCSLCCSFIDSFAVDDAAYTFNGGIRGCVTSDKEGCAYYKDESIAWTSYTDFTGKFCICKEDLCNTASSGNSVPQTSAGRMSVTFTVVSLLALAAARSLSQ